MNELIKPSQGRRDAMEARESRRSMQAIVPVPRRSISMIGAKHDGQGIPVPLIRRHSPSVMQRRRAADTPAHATEA